MRFLVLCALAFLALTLHALPVPCVHRGEQVPLASDTHRAPCGHVDEGLAEDSEVEEEAEDDLEGGTGESVHVPDLSPGRARGRAEARAKPAPLCAQIVAAIPGRAPPHLS